MAEQMVDQSEALLTVDALENVHELLVVRGPEATAQALMKYTPTQAAQALDHLVASGEGKAVDEVIGFLPDKHAKESVGEMNPIAIGRMMNDFDGRDTIITHVVEDAQVSGVIASAITLTGREITHEEILDAVYEVLRDHEDSITTVVSELGTELFAFLLQVYAGADGTWDISELLDSEESRVDTDALAAFRMTPSDFEITDDRARSVIDALFQNDTQSFFDAVQLAVQMEPVALEREVNAALQDLWERLEKQQRSYRPKDAETIAERESLMGLMQSIVG